MKAIIKILKFLIFISLAILPISCAVDENESIMLSEPDQDFEDSDALIAHSRNGSSLAESHGKKSQKFTDTTESESQSTKNKVLIAEVSNSKMKVQVWHPNEVVDTGNPSGVGDEQAFHSNEAVDSGNPLGEEEDNQYQAMDTGLNKEADAVDSGNPLGKEEEDLHANQNLNKESEAVDSGNPLGVDDEGPNTAGKDNEQLTPQNGNINMIDDFEYDTINADMDPIEEDQKQEDQNQFPFFFQFPKGGTADDIAVDGQIQYKFEWVPQIRKIDLLKGEEIKNTIDFDSSSSVRQKFPEDIEKSLSLTVEATNTDFDKVRVYFHDYATETLGGVAEIKKIFFKNATIPNSYNEYFEKSLSSSDSKVVIIYFPKAPYNHPNDNTGIILEQ